MTCCISSSSSRAVAVIAAGTAMALAGCSGSRAAVWPGHSDDAHPVRIALLPPENLSGAPAPLRDIEIAAERALARVGIEVVSGALVDEFLARHRIRYTGGLDRDGAAAMREELGVSAAMVTSVVLHSEIAPPRIGVIARLVSAADEPEILWIDGFGRTGVDSPGLLGLGYVDSVGPLREEAFRALSLSLRDFLRDARRRSPSCSTSAKFAPKVAFRSPALAQSESLSVAVLPFVNNTGRRGAGQVLALEVARQLMAVDRVKVIEPGMLREELMLYRVTTEGGASPATARLLSKFLKADLIVSGVIRDYDDTLTPVIGFSAEAIDPKTEETVWEATSYNRGDDAMALFGTGTISTANVLACHMVRAAVIQMFRRRQPAGRALAQGPRRQGRSPQLLRSKIRRPRRKSLN